MKEGASAIGGAGPLSVPPVSGKGESRRAGGVRGGVSKRRNGGGLAA